MGIEPGSNVFLFSATRLEDVMREMHTMKPRAVIVDSIQTVYLDDVTSSAGSVSQVRPDDDLGSIAQIMRKHHWYLHVTGTERYGKHNPQHCF